MKKLIKRVCLTLMVALLGVVPLIKADSADGATTTQIAINNILNIQVEDQFGNVIDFGTMDVNTANGSDYVTMYLNTGKINAYGLRVCKMEEESKFYYYDFQKYLSNGTVTGISDPSINVVGYDYSNMWIPSGTKQVRVWYRPNKTDYTLDANKVGLFVDAAWKNALTCSIDIGSKKVDIKNTTGLSLYSLSAGTHSGWYYYGTSRSDHYSNLKSSSTKTEYVKKKIKLSEVNSQYFKNDGTINHNNVITKIGSSDSSKLAILICISGGMVTIPVPDSQGFVEVYVEKSTGKVDFYMSSLLNGMSGLSVQSSINGYPHVDMNVQLKSEPATGSSVMGMETGKYTVDFYPGNNQYASIYSYPIEIKNSDNVQTFKIIAHKHVYNAWKSDSINHWKECCDIKREISNHSWGSWVIDKPATEEAEGSKYRICTVCNYKNTAIINKVTHTHKPSNTWSTDDNYHWKECKCGNISSKSTHLYGSWVTDKAATEDATGSKHRNCTVCKYKQTEIIAKLPHTHKESASWTKNSTKHWKVCPCGTSINVGNHTYGSWMIDRNATEVVEGSKHRNCTVCNYKQTESIAKLPHTHKYSTELSKNADNHWYECPCGDKKDLGNHSSSKEATETTAKICDSCGYIMSPATGHITHTEDNAKFYCDENTHWYQCVGCTVKMSEKSHEFRWVIDYEATEDMTGLKHEECTDCGYKKEAVEIPQIIIETELDTETPTEETTKQDTTVAPTVTESETEIQETESKKDNDYKIIFIIIGIVVGVGAASALIIILAKKKKKTEE